MERMEASYVAALLQQLIDLLDSEPNWHRQFHQAFRQYQHGNHIGAAQTLLATSGGMGSANDLLLPATSKLTMAQRNQRYHELLAQLYVWSRQRIAQQ